MNKLNRRDVGYTIISRLETEWRALIEEYAATRFGNSQNFIPSAVIEKAKVRGNLGDDWTIDSLLDETDFPDLSEIICYSNNYKLFVSKDIAKKEFSEITSLLYVLRCKIAHVKGEFTSVDLDKLISFSKKFINLFEEFTHTKHFINTIENSPENATILAMPVSFANNNYEKSGTPNNLPIADYEVEGGFVGRLEDKKTLNKLLATPKFPIVTITGAGGVGKTSLAISIAKDILTDGTINFDAIVWLSAKEDMLSPIGIEEIEPSLKSYEDMLDTIISVLGFGDEIQHVSNIDEKYKVAELLFETTNSILVIVDNLETINDERIRDFLIDAPMNVKFLVTSRRGIGQVERRHNLLQMKELEAIHLFRQIARDKKLAMLSQLDNDVIKAYVNKISCYPLAIKWVIGQVARGKDINLVVNSIQESTSDIAKFCFDQIFNDLSKDCRLILFALTALGTPPTTGLLKYIVDLDNNEFEEAVEELILVSLIVQEHHKSMNGEVAGKYSILSLTKSYLHYYLSQEPDVKSYLEHRINGIQGMISANELVRKEYRYILSNFGATTDEEKVASMLLQAATQKQGSGNFDNAIEDCKSALSVAPRFSPIHRVWASILSSEGKIEESLPHIERAIDLNSNDVQNWVTWGSILRKNNRQREAAGKYAEAIKLFPTEIILLNTYGKLLSDLREYEEADKLLTIALSLESDDTSRRQQVITLVTLARNLISWGDLLIRRGLLPEAEDKLLNAYVHCKSALNLDINDNSAKTTILRTNLKLAQYYRRLGRHDDAKAYLEFVSTSQHIGLHAEMFVISAKIEVCKYYIREGKIRNAQDYFKGITIENDLLFKRFPPIQEDYRKTHSMLESMRITRGVILSTDSDNSRIIIINPLDRRRAYAATSRDFIDPNSFPINSSEKNIFFIPTQEKIPNSNYYKAIAVTFNKPED